MVFLVYESGTFLSTSGIAACISVDGTRTFLCIREMPGLTYGQRKVGEDWRVGRGGGLAEDGRKGKGGIVGGERSS